MAIDDYKGASQRLSVFSRLTKMRPTVAPLQHQGILSDTRSRQERPVQSDASEKGTESLKSDRRSFKTIALNSGSLYAEVMVYRAERSHRPPLLILNSVEFPMPPSEDFCEKLWVAGYQVIFVRRPGFGQTRALPDAVLTRAYLKTGAAVITEAALLMQLIHKLDLKRIRLLAVGSANPVAFRLSLMSRSIDLSVFVNPAFNQEFVDDLKPAWLGAMLSQIMETDSGLDIAIKGLKSAIDRDPVNFYKTLSSSSAGDLEYVEANLDDIRRASALLQSITPEMVLYEVTQSVQVDPLLKDGLFAGLPALAISGQQTQTDWQRGLEREANRLSIDLDYVPVGNYFVPYASPEFLIEKLKEKAPLKKQTS